MADHHDSTLMRYERMRQHDQESVERLLGVATGFVEQARAFVAQSDGSHANFDSVIGLSPERAAGLLPLGMYFLRSESLAVVPDTQRDVALAAGLGHVAAEIRFAAGRRLQKSDGSLLGVFCLVAAEPQQLSELTSMSLNALAAQIQAELQRQQHLEQLSARHLQHLTELELLRALLNAAGRYAIVGTDPSGVVTWFSAGAEVLLGFDKNEVVGRCNLVSFHDDLAPQREARPTAPQAEAFRRLVGSARQGAPQGTRFVYRRRDGSTFPAWVVIAPMLSESGTITGFVAVVDDESERVAAAAAKSEFVSMVSHELRTPLTSILGAFGLLAGGAAGALPDKATDLLVIAERNASRLLHLVNDILEMQKLDASKLELQLEPCDLVEVLERARAANAPLAESGGVQLNFASPGRVLAQVDSARLEQVATNLLSNAIRYSEAGDAVQLGLEVVDGQARISVSDDGPGIDPKFHDRIFDRFAQGPVQPKGASKGTGLGLAIARGIVELHGGRIRVKSEVGLGATFVVDLPLAADDAPGTPL